LPAVDSEPEQLAVGCSAAEPALLLAGGFAAELEQLSAAHRSASANELASD
jgi:hypothetical protein